jgi:diguanylate cyclase (GGDEF)-like protein
MGSAFGLALATNLKLTRESEKLAQFDALTNLPNRRYFEERLEQAERRAIAAGGNLALIYCDLDGFKHVNDTLGHEAGDEVLRVVAVRLRQTMHENMCLARLGGDEFLVLLEKPGRPEEILSLVRAMRTAVGQEMEVAGIKLTPKISCGMALYPEDVSSAADMVRLADSAMYAMKQQARSADPENPLGWRSAAPRLAAD